MRHGPSVHGASYFLRYNTLHMNDEIEKVAPGAHLLDESIEWKPIIAEWIIRRDVLDAAIPQLEREDVELADVVRAIHETSDPRTSEFVVRQAVYKILKKYSGKKFEKGGKEILLKVFERQRKWLEANKNRPPESYLRSLPRTIVEALYAKYPEKRE